MSEKDLRTEMRRGNLIVIAEPVFSSTSTETAVDKMKKLILQHVSDDNWPKKRVKITSNV